MWEDILKGDSRKFETMLSVELSKAGMPIKLLREILHGLSRKELLHYGKMVQVMKPELIKKIVDLWVRYREVIGDKVRVAGADSNVNEEDFNQATEEEIIQLRKYLLHLLETKNL
tara:strand:+ start:10468 stop:10812 length:345 start_codon:yes stop_codon:yes gene_type:complete